MVTQTRQVVTDNYRNGIKRLPTDLLKIDGSYQRQLSRTKVNQIAEQWLPDAAGVILVSRRQDGYYVVDGQHRVAAAQRLGVSTLMCQEVDELSIKDEAYRFYLCNTARGNPRTIDTFKARLMYGDEHAVAVHNIITEAGYSVRWSGGVDDDTPYVLVAIGACERVYRGLFPKGARAKPHPELLRKTMDTITLAWGGSSGATKKLLIEGLGVFYKHYGEEVRVEDVADRLQRVSPKVIAREAAALSIASLTGWQVARVILKYVNYRRGQHNRLPDRIEVRA